MSGVPSHPKYCLLGNAGSCSRIILAPSRKKAREPEREPEKARAQCRTWEVPWISNLLAHNSMTSGSRCIQHLRQSHPRLLPLPWATSPYSPSPLLPVIWSDFCIKHVLGHLGWLDPKVTCLGRNAHSSQSRISSYIRGPHGLRPRFLWHYGYIMPHYMYVSHPHQWLLISFPSKSDGNQNLGLKVIFHYFTYVLKFTLNICFIWKFDCDKQNNGLSKIFMS